MRLPMNLIFLLLPLFQRAARRGACLWIQFLTILLTGFIALPVANGQVQTTAVDLTRDKNSPRHHAETGTTEASVATERWIANYVDPVQGAPSVDLVRRALSANAELAAVRLEIVRARARLRQAGLRPNPTLDFEQQNGVFNSPGERATSIGISVPLEISGQRRRRIDLAKAEFEAAEAEVADRERRLAGEVRSAYADALAAVRELEVTQNLNTLDVEMARIVEARVNEGESALLELNLMRTEVDRLRARRALVEGRLQAAMLRLKQLVGVPMDESLRLREELTVPVLPEPPASLEAAVEIALRTRPDLRLARLTEE